MTILVLSGVLALWLGAMMDDRRANGHVGRSLFWAFLALSVVLGLSIRLPGLGRSLWLDEFGTLWTVEGTVGQAVRRATEFHGQSPLYYLILWPIVHGFGESEIVLRVPSLVIGVLTAVMVGLAARVAAGTSAGIVAGALGWLSAGQIAASVNARPYVLALFCCSIAIFGFLGAVRDATRPRRWAFVLGGAGLVLSHYVFAPVLAGLVAGYALLPALRSRYRSREFIVDCVWLAGLCSVAVPQVLMLWNRKSNLVWLPRADYLTFVPSLMPLAVPALVALARPRRLEWPATERVLWLAAGAQLATLSGLAATGTNLLAPRYLDVIAIPLAVAAGLSVSRVSAGPRIVGLGYSVALTGLLLVTAYRATGQFTLVPQHDWRAAVAEARKVVSLEPGPVLYRSGFVEQTQTIDDTASAMLSPLRSPGARLPEFRLVSLPFSWQAPAALRQRETDLAGLLRELPPVYLLTIHDGYSGRFSDWVQGQSAGVACRSIAQFDGVDLLRCGRGGSR